jgi:regulator of replication initiation timing
MDLILHLRQENARLRLENERLRQLLAQYGVKIDEKDGKIEKR